MTIDAKGKAPESWNCVDCGINTAPGLLNRVEIERAFSTAIALEKLGGPKASVDQRVGEDTEVYYVRDKVWDASGVEGMGGCLVEPWVVAGALFLSIQEAGRVHDKSRQPELRQRRLQARHAG